MNHQILLTPLLCLALMGTLSPGVLSQESKKQAMQMCQQEEIQADIISGCSWLLETDQDITLHLTINALVRRGVTYDRMGEYALAIDDYSEAIDRTRDQAQLYQLRGMAWSSNNEHSKAERDFSKAIRIDPLDSKSWFYRGYAHAQQKDYEDAIADYSEAIELNPEFAKAYNNRGNSYLHLGDCKRGLPDMERTIEIDPNHALAYTNRADCHFESGKFDLALLDHNKSLELDPDNPDLLNASCWNKALMGATESALKDCNKAIRIAPEIHAFYDSRALVYYQNKQYKYALLEEEKAFEDASWENHLLRAAIYFQLGETEYARADYKKARKLHRDKKAIAKRLNRLGLEHDQLR
jgi:tetratricopeptide (TPR) repeat protein